MALKKLKLKLKSDLKKTVESGNKKGDSRYLNYFDLKKDEKMVILLLPDVNGELWTEYRNHGPNLGVRGVGSMRCIHEATGETCPMCQQGFEALDLFKETGDEEYKKLAKKWFARDYTIMSCLVLESPFEVSESPDHNEVKLFSVPYAIKNKIKQAVIEGEIDEDLLFQTPFVIKKTENTGGFASYEHSYFRRQLLNDDETEYFEDRVVEQFDYQNLDALPPIPTLEEVSKWIEKAAAALNLETEEEEEEKPRRGRTTTRRDDDDEEEEGKYQRNTARKSRPADDEEEEEAPKPRRRAEPEDEEEEKPRSSRRSEPEEEEEEVKAPKKTTAASTSGGGLRDRLRNLK